MKIIDNDEVFIIPESKIPIILCDNGYKNKLIDLLNGYFTQKKKTKCSVFSDLGDALKCSEAEFIYIPCDTSIDANFHFKNKSMLNSSLTNIVNENEECFTSLELIRQGLKGLISDKGIIKFSKIIFNGIDNIEPFIEFDKLNINSLLENLYIDTETINYPEKMMILYNLSIFLNRNSYKIIYIDFSITDSVINWIKTISTDSLILIDNNAFESFIQNDYELVILSNKNFVEMIEANEQLINNVSYLFHPIVRANKHQQTEKNIKILDNFSDTNTTFYLKY